MKVCGRIHAGYAFWSTGYRTTRRPRRTQVQTAVRMRSLVIQRTAGGFGSLWCRGRREEGHGQRKHGFRQGYRQGPGIVPS